MLQRLLEQILTCDGLLPSCHLQAEPVTLFQFYRYLERHRIGSLEKHLAKLAKEGKGSAWLLLQGSALQAPAPEQEPAQPSH